MAASTWTLPLSVNTSCLGTELTARLIADFAKFKVQQRKNEQQG